jgi:hypothetical protein
MKQQLYEYATCHDEPQLAEWLAAEAKFDQAANFAQQRATFGRKTYLPYFANHFKDILKQCEQYGIEHRLPMNLTPLMAAAAAGNVALVEALLERGADRDAVDHYGYNALHWALREGFRDAKFARGPLAALYEPLAPASIDVNTGERLVRLDRHLSEYFLFQTLWVLFKSRFTHRQRRTNGAFESQAILDAWQYLPANIVRPERNRRPASFQRPCAQRNRPRLRVQPGAVQARQPGLVPAQSKTRRPSRARATRRHGRRSVPRSTCR